MASEDNPGNGAQSPSLNVLAQYVKDFSFESPGAPLSLRPREKAPNIAINVNVNANPLSDTDFDVNLTLEAKATDGKDVLFATELAYGGVFRIADFRRNICCRCSSSSVRGFCSHLPVKSLQGNAQWRVPSADD